MAIPYNIKAEYAKGRIKSYKIVHNDDCKEEDRPNILSEGEKCIISLLMFIFKCKKDNSNLIILDDPASYYDDFRRAQILKILEKELDGRTILILSHDDVYAKYAISDKYKRTGTILFFENFGEIANFIEITKDEFGDFNEMESIGYACIGMCDNITSVTIPFVSAGGSSMVVSGFMIGMLIACQSPVFRESASNKKQKEVPAWRWSE